MPTADPLALAMTERALQANVEQAALWCGWLVYHTHDSRRSQPGFPDLCLARQLDGRLVFAELKSQRGRIRPEQQTWLDALRAVACPEHKDTGGSVPLPEVYLWRPADWLDGTIERVLR